MTNKEATNLIRSLSPDRRESLTQRLELLAAASNVGLVKLKDPQLLKHVQRRLKGFGTS